MPAWGFAFAILTMGFSQAAYCDPLFAKWVDRSEEAVAYEWSWAPMPDEAGGMLAIIAQWAGDPWEEMPGPEAVAPWPHCYGGELSPPGPGWVRVRVVSPRGLRSEWSNAKPVPEPPSMLAIGFGIFALLGHCSGGLNTGKRLDELECG